MIRQTSVSYLQFEHSSMGRELSLPWKIINIQHLQFDNYKRSEMGLPLESRLSEKHCYYWQNANNKIELQTSEWWLLKMKSDNYHGFLLFCTPMVVKSTINHNIPQNCQKKSLQLILHFVALLTCQSVLPGWKYYNR